MATATDLSPEIWNGIARAIDQGQALREIVLGTVVKRDDVQKLVWVAEFGDLAIPLAAFASGFSYYDTDVAGVVQKKEDTTGTNDALKTKLITPQVGEIAVVLDPGGQHRFPVCVGVIQSTGFWQGEG